MRIPEEHEELPKQPRVETILPVKQQQIQQTIPRLNAHRRVNQAPECHIHVIHNFA